ncbi:MAG: glycosyltransferase family 4 protein [Patulibacter minatonensis]
MGWPAGLPARTGALLIGLARRLRRASRPTERAPGPLRVAMLCDTLLRYGTAQATGLQAAGYEVTCYWIDRLTDFGDDETRALADRQRVLDLAAAGGVELVRLPRRDMRRFLDQTRALHRDLRRRRIDAVVVQTHLDPRYVTVGLRFPTVVILHDPRPHSGDYDSHHAAPFRAITRASELTSAALVVHGSGLLPSIRPSLAALPRHVVPHGAAVRPAPTPVPVAPTILLTGRLMAYKGIDTALAAMPLIRAQRPDARMVIAGNGRMAAEVRAASADGVELRDGYVPEAEYEQLLEQARIVVLPYRDATQSGVGLQAVARGIPVVVSATGALPELVPAERPEWIVPPGDAAALAAAILRALDHSDADRALVHGMAHDRFDWPVVGRELGAVLEQAAQ